jgi:hypothetical protein
MRNRSLHERLRAFCEQAAFQLESEAAAVDDLPFEVVAQPGARTPLYCYRPLTGEFIRERADLLEQLPAYSSAAGALVGLAGVDEFLRLRGEAPVPEDPAGLAHAALRAFLSAMYVESTDFEFSPRRFERVYDQLEAAVYQRRSLTAVIAPIHGLSLVSPEVPLDEHMSLVRGDSLDDVPPEAVWSGPGGGDGPNALALLTLEDAGSEERALALAGDRFSRLLTALRLADAGAFALGPSAWLRSDAGAWRVVALPGARAPVAVPERYGVAAEEEDELRGFCNLVGRRVGQASAELAWALNRFEAGCERSDPAQALTDHLLALRALLEPEGPGSGRMAQRLAAICAVPEERSALAERAAHAVSLERAVIAGLPPAEPDAEGLVDEIADHLRSLVRDVLCGHLDADLVSVADRLLAEAITGETEPVDGTDEPGEARVEPVGDTPEPVLASRPG